MGALRPVGGWVRPTLTHCCGHEILTVVGPVRFYNKSVHVFCAQCCATQTRAKRTLDTKGATLVVLLNCNDFFRYSVLHFPLGLVPAKYIVIANRTHTSSTYSCA